MKTSASSVNARGSSVPVAMALTNPPCMRNFVKSWMNGSKRQFRIANLCRHQPLAQGSFSESRDSGQTPGQRLSSPDFRREGSQASNEALFRILHLAG
jgi:hypothetical protein